MNEYLKEKFKIKYGEHVFDYLSTRTVASLSRSGVTNEDIYNCNSEFEFRTLFRRMNTHNIGPVSMREIIKYHEYLLSSRSDEDKKEDLLDKVSKLCKESGVDFIFVTEGGRFSWGIKKSNRVEMLVQLDNISSIINNSSQ